MTILLYYVKTNGCMCVLSPGTVDNCRDCCSTLGSGKADKSCSRKHPPLGQQNPLSAPCWLPWDLATVKSGSLKQHLTLT